MPLLPKLEDIIKSITKKYSSIRKRPKQGGRSSFTSLARVITLLGVLAACKGADEGKKECETDDQCEDWMGFDRFCDRFHEKGTCVLAHEEGVAYENYDYISGRLIPTGFYYGFTDKQGLVISHPYDSEIPVDSVTLFVTDDYGMPIRDARVDLFYRSQSVAVHVYHPNFTSHLRAFPIQSPARSADKRYQISLTSAPMMFDAYHHDDPDHSLDAITAFSELLEDPDAYYGCVPHEEVVLRYNIGSFIIKKLFLSGTDEITAVINKALTIEPYLSDILEQYDIAPIIPDVTENCQVAHQYVYLPNTPTPATAAISTFVCQASIDEIVGNHKDDDCDGIIDEDCRIPRFEDQETVCIDNTVYILDTCGEPAELLVDCDHHMEGSICNSGGWCACIPNYRWECVADYLYSVDSCGINWEILENCSADGYICEDDHCVEEILGCVPHFDQVCHDGDVYWIDNCGNVEEIYYACAASQHCSGGSCIDDSPSCSSHYSTICWDGNVRWVDSCGNIEGIQDDCSDAETCIDDVCTAIIESEGRIAFSSLRDGNWEIYTMNADGTDQRRITSNSTDDYWPAWSPGGARIAFEASRDGNSEIYMMDPDGTSPSRITNNSSIDVTPAWSPDGGAIAFTSYRDGNAEIYVIRDVSSGSTLHPENITNNDSDDKYPSWSPDGEKIVFSSDRGRNLMYDLYTINSDGTEVRRLTDYGAVIEKSSWSPDGTKIAFEMWALEGAPLGQLYALTLSSSTLYRLTNNSFADFNPSWSPDGRKIVFSSNRDGNGEIYTMEPDGSEQTNITNHDGDDSTPSWTFDY